MSTKINAGSGENAPVRGEMFRVDPFEVIVKEELRGRRSPPADSVVVERAVSMHTYGQQQPITARRQVIDGEKNKLVVMIGFTRTDAARLIVKGFEHEVEKEVDGQMVMVKETIHDPQFKLKVIVDDCNDETALIKNIQENAQRENCSPMDDAENQGRLRDRYGYTDAKIAKIYGYNHQVKVSMLKKLLLLPEDVKRMVHEGKMAVSAAIDLLDLDPEEQQDSLASLRKEDGSVNGAELRSWVREKILAKSEQVAALATATATVEGGEAPAAAPEAPEAPANTKHALSLKLLRKECEAFFEKDAENKPKFDPAIIKFAKTLLKRINGQVTQATLQKAVEALLDAERTVDAE